MAANSFWEYANPARFTAIADRALPVLWAAAAVLLAVGLSWGLLFTPDDYRQGAAAKIMYVHVPTAMMAINCWLMMVAASLIWLVRRHHVSALLARAAAPVGAVMTLAAMITGAIWGQPIWGTWWAWDPRLTSFLILLLFYFGYIALCAAVEEDTVAADLSAILCLVGSVFALLSRYAVNFWSQGLHQGASLSLDRAEHVADVFYVPLLVCLAGFVALFLALALTRTRTEIRVRRIRTLLAAEAPR